MKFYKIFFLLFALFIVFSCQNNAEKAEKTASIELSRINTFIEKGMYQDAKSAIDSFHIVYRKYVKIRRKADVLTDTIEMRENVKNIAFINKQLPQLQTDFDTDFKNIRTEKSKYQDVQLYFPKSYSETANANSNSLNAYFDEKGILYLVSNYSGKSLNHNRIRLTSGNFSTESSAGEGTTHQYSIDGTQFERLTFQDSVALQLASFIINNQNVQVEISGKGNYSYKLPTSNIAWIKTAYNGRLSKSALEKAKKELQLSINKVQMIQLKNK